VAGGRRFTWAEVDVHVSRWAARLLAAGVRDGARVAVLSHNRAEWVWLLHAAARTRAVLVPLNVRWTAGEFDSALNRVAPALVLVEGGLEGRVARGVNLESFAEAPGDFEPCPAEVDDGAGRAWLFTSGTTGVSRVVELTGGNFSASARASALNLGSEPGQAWLGCLPLFHVGGLALLTRAAEYGARVVLQDGFEPVQVAAALERERVTHLSVVPTGLRRLLQVHAGRAPATLRAVLVGGGPSPLGLLAEARARGWPVLQTYGLTEACSQVATERPGEADGMSSGRPLAGTEVRVVDGELQVRGPTVMRGYAGDAAANARAFTADGWLRTGDLGELDGSGRVVVHARRTDLVLTGGENVYPAEVEAVILSLPGVEDAAVSGVPDEEWGQRVAAAVVSTAGVTPALLEQHCRAHLAGYKVPRRWKVVPGLPRNAGGKVDRVALRNLLQKPD
jgi:O-succinylbenzoic acid--CoA ligase